MRSGIPYTITPTFLTWLDETRPKAAARIRASGTTVCELRLGSRMLGFYFHEITQDATSRDFDRAIDVDCALICATRSPALLERLDIPPCGPNLGEVGHLTGRLYVVADQCGVARSDAERIAAFLLATDPRIKATLETLVDAIVTKAKTANVRQQVERACAAALDRYAGQFVTPGLREDATRDCLNAISHLVPRDHQFSIRVETEPHNPNKLRFVVTNRLKAGWDENAVHGTCQRFGAVSPDPKHQNVLTVGVDGHMSLTFGDLAKTPGQLIQRFEMNGHDLCAITTSVLSGATLVDLSAVVPKVRAALGLAEGVALVVNTVLVQSTGTGKDKLVVNGVEVPL